MESVRTNSKIITYDLTRFAGTIGNKGLTFISIIKITIILSVLLSLLMLLIQ
jgi:hypothetical protein